LANHTIFAIITGTAPQVDDQQRLLRPSFIHGRPTFCLWISLFTLKNNIAILYERNEPWVNENAYGVIKSLMESPIWI
jgi:hypothetical protein